MSSVLFIIASASGHYHSTFKLAHVLQSKGHHIVYTGEELYAELVLKQGFEFRLCQMPLANRSLHNLHPIRVFRKYFRERHQDIAYQTFLADLQEFEAVCEDIQPNLIIVDSHLSPYAILLRASGANCILIQTMLCSEKVPLVPPLSSRLVPKPTRWYKYWIEILWQAYFLKRDMGNSVDWMLRAGQDNVRLIKRKLQSEGFRMDEVVYTKKAFQLGVKNMPELILYPAEFDYPWKEKLAHQYLLGPMVDLTRKDTVLDERYTQVMEQVKAARNACTDGSFKVIYFSLGTVAGYHNKNFPVFLDRVISAFRHEPQWRLVISLGKEADVSQVSGLPTNVHLLSKVPQIDILRHCDAMITHGGLNTVKECILLNVPMIVYPLSKETDQNGNSARIVYHGLGVQGNLQKDSKEDIIGKVRKVLEESSYRANVLKMSQLFAKYNESEEAVEVIESLLISDLVV